MSAWCKKVLLYGSVECACSSLSEWVLSLASSWSPDTWTSGRVWTDLWECVSMVASWWSGAGNNVILWPPSAKGHDLAILWCAYADFTHGVTWLWTVSPKTFLRFVRLAQAGNCGSKHFYIFFLCVFTSSYGILAMMPQLGFATRPKVVASSHGKLLWEKLTDGTKIKGRAPGDKIICHSQG